MSNPSSNSKSILFDADVIIHFISGDKLLDLFSIFRNQSLLLDTVYAELSINPRTKTTIDNLLNIGLIRSVTLNGDLEMLKEYAHLTSSLVNRGKGESACMSYCWKNKDIIASSNLSDVKEYCKRHSIQILTTGDFIKEAYTTRKWNKQDCKEFILRLVAKKHRVPFKDFASFAKKFNCQ